MCDKKVLQEIKLKERKEKALLILVILNWINVALTLIILLCDF